MVKTKPSVLLVNRVYPPVRGATGRVLRDLAREMARAGWNVTVITTGEKSFSEKDGSINLNRVKAPMSPRGFISYGLVLLKLFLGVARMPRHDLVITMTDPPFLVTLGRWYARKHRCAHVHWCQDLYPDLFIPIGVKLPQFVLRWLAKLSRRSMNQSGKVIAIGRCMARYLAHTGVENGKISVVTNWPDLELVDQNNVPSTSTVNIQNHLPAAKPSQHLFRDDSPRFRVLYAGSIGKAHPLNTILEAAEHLSIHPEIEFAFVGEGPSHERLAAERAKRGLQNIKLMPYQPASYLKDMMESGDVHLISAKDETAGLLVPSKFYSAVASARPAIYIGPADTEVGRMIRDYGCGAIVPQGDGKTLAQAILYFRNDSDAWFGAQQGAVNAASDCRPVKSILSIMKEAELAIQNRAA